MNEDLLFAYSLQDGDFVQWIMQYPILVDKVVAALVTLHNRDGSSHLSDLVACRDAALTMHMIAREGGFEDVAAVFSEQYDLFSRAVLPFFGEVA